MTARFYPGDIVRRKTDSPYASHAAKAGDVVMVVAGREISSAKGGTVWFVPPATDGRPAVWTEGELFELIARAGEPVRYQPGDVVELIEDDGRERKGERFTVREQTSPNRGGITPQGYLWYTNSRCIRAHRCKLVHRPAKSEPLVFTPPEPMDWSSVRVGDRVRVTFEGKVRKAHDHGGLNVVLDGGPFSTPFSAKELAEGKVEIIERAEKPLAVGDRVEHVNGATSRRFGYRVRLIEDDALVIAQEGGSLCVVERKMWKRVP